MIKRLLRYSLLFVLISCDITNDKTTVVEYVNGKQKLSVDSVDKNGNSFDVSKLELNGKDTVIINKVAVFKLTVSNPNLQIQRAYFDCDTDAETLVDTTDYRIGECRKQLTVINDTIVIQLTPTLTGKKEFQTITAVTVDEDKIVRIVRGSFDYFVTE